MAKTHGMSRTPIYWLWVGMKQRCSNPLGNRWHIYHRVSVCERWMVFEHFYSDMGERPEGMSIDRIDNDGNYSCGKCEECKSKGWTMNGRWATPLEQSANSRRIRLVTINGETKRLSEWCKLFGVTRHCVYSRIADGMSIEKAITTEKYLGNRGEARANHKLTDRDVEDIRKLAQSGVRVNALARQFGVNHKTICQVINRVIWKHVS